MTISEMTDWLCCPMIAIAPVACSVMQYTKLIAQSLLLLDLGKLLLYLI